MKIYYVNRTDETDYDEYDSMVVIAESEDQARCIHPSSETSNLITWDGTFWIRGGVIYWDKPDYIWQMPWKLDVQLIGLAEPHEDRPRVVLGSFNAG